MKNDEMACELSEFDCEAYNYYISEEEYIIKNKLSYKIKDYFYTKIYILKIKFEDFKNKILKKENIPF